ncbi:hypothetical protein KALB_8274 [Kutzneria albida DSM 43870]|uniref:ATP-grasp domain-containing protein n=1 Tax=Kutzneria albida DSM 43870 TaxID=1449976 RepID=W5WLL1_9PSEU|nr:hypothetical protein KALB_8274 [Kutzneria albida DSM 43870]
MDHVFAALSERLRGLFGGRRIVLAGGSRLSARVQELSSLEAERTLVISTDDHAPLHDPEVARWVTLGITGLVASEQSSLENALDSAEVRAVLEEFDPTGQALVIGSNYMGLPEVAGRPVLNHRRPEWIELENKTTIDQLWSELSVPHAPAHVVDVAEDALWRLWQVSELMDSGWGVVWSGDGPAINGGANFVRRVRTHAEARRVYRYLAPKCTNIRVMPFLEGIPVSVHGIVFPDGTAVLRPIEMVVPRRTESAKFLYAGCASYYDPPAAIRDEMRNLARRVGEQLRGTVGYRGTFTLDGVATADGFRPTEVNTRYGGAMTCFEDALPQLPLALLQVALVAGHEAGISSIEFEDLLVSAADTTRISAIGANVKAVRPESEVERPVVWTEWACRWAHEDEPAHGSLRLRPGPVGGRLELELYQEAVRPGRPAAPLVVSAFALADQDWGTGVGRLEPAIAMACEREVEAEVAFEAVTA